MVNAIQYSLMIFGKWIELIFNEFSFNYQSFNVSVGWVFIGCALIEIVINSVLNIPSRLPSRAFFTENKWYTTNWKQYEYGYKRDSYVRQKVRGDRARIRKWGKA